MGQTNFTAKVSGDKFFATEYMQIINAINNIEGAMNMNIGTSTAQIPDANLASGINAAKINPSTNLTINQLIATSDASLRGVTTFNGTGYISIVNGHQVLKIGPDSLVASDGSRNTLEVNNIGEVSLRGYVDTDSDSILRGELHATSGNFSGDVTVGGSTGISIRGSTKTITVGTNGRIEAGSAYIDSSGIHLEEGSISLSDGAATPTTVFTVTSTGALTAKNVDIEGTVTAIAGLIGGITVNATGIYVGGQGSGTTGFSLDSSGYLYAKQGSFTGEVNAQTGTLGNLTVTGTITGTGFTLSGSGLAITQGSINLGNGAFTVDNAGNVVATSGQFNGHFTAQSGSVTGTFSAGSVVMSPSGLSVDGADGIKVSSGSITIWDESTTPVKIVTIGKYGSEYGIEVKNLSAQQTFVVDSSGDVTVRGTVYATDGEFTGTVTATGGSFANVNVSGTITVQAGGSILAGTSTIDDTGIHITQGSITLGNFTMDSSGNVTATNLTATNVDLSGTISTDDAEVTGILTIGPKAATPTAQLHLDGVNQRIVSGGVVIDNDGITITDGSINIANKFIVDSLGNLTATSAEITGTINATDGQFTGTVTAGDNVLISSAGIHIQDNQSVEHVAIGALDDGYFGIQAGFAILNNDGLRIRDNVGNTVLQLGYWQTAGGTPTDEYGMVVYKDGSPTLTIDKLGNIVMTGSINATGGTIDGNLTVSDGLSDIRIIGSPSGVADLAGIYLFEPDPGDGIVRLVADSTHMGLEYSPDGGSNWYPAMDGKGITANALTDGDMIIIDTDVEGGANGIRILRHVTDEQVTLPSDDPTGYVSLAHKKVDVLEVWNESKTTQYSEGTDYDVNEVDGTIARVGGSSIPVGAKILVTYNWKSIDIDSQNGISVYEGNLQVTSPDGATTLVGGGFLHVKGLDVGVFQSDNFVSNGNFGQISTLWGTKQTTDNKDLPGYPAYTPGEDFYGDWFTDRAGNTYRYGVSYWIPSKSDTTYNGPDVTGFAQVAFAPHDFLHNIFGYANIMCEGMTAQWGQIEQDIYPFLNFTNGDFIVPGEEHQDVVLSAGFHWHADHSDQNTITMEVDELIPNFVFVESTRTAPFTPIWDNVNEQYEGLTFTGTWTTVDNEHGAGTGDNVTYGATVTTNASGFVAGTEDHVVDNMFVAEYLATQTQGTGYHYCQVDLGSAQNINQIWVWHSTNENRIYQDHKIEVSADGTNWTTIYDTTSATPDPEWTEGYNGLKVNFAPTSVRYIRDWINGYVTTDATPETFGENQWLDIQARYVAYKKTSTPGDFIEWTFTPKTRCDIWISYSRGTTHGKGSVYLNGNKVAIIDQSTLEEGHDHALAYIDISSQESTLLIPNREYTLRVEFDDIPENVGKHFTFNRIKLEDFRKEADTYTTSIVVASQNVRPVNPYAFYRPHVVPDKAKNFKGLGRQILRGTFDSPANFSKARGCWIRYRIRIRSEREASMHHGHDHVMISHVIMERGTKPTYFRRSSQDTLPSNLLQEWNPTIPTATGVQTKHLGDRVITGDKVALDTLYNENIASDAAIATSKIAFDAGELHSHGSALTFLNQVTGWGTSGDDYKIAHSNHVHNSHTPTGLFQFVNNGLAVELRPSSNPNADRTDNGVQLSGTTPVSLSFSPIDVFSEVVEPAGGGTAYVRDLDYAMDYANGTIARLEDGNITDGASVDVSYVQTKVLMQVREWNTNDIHFHLDSRGNIKAKSITVQLSSSTTSGSTSGGDFTVEGNFVVRGNTTLGSNADDDTVSILGQLTINTNAIDDPLIINADGNEIFRLEVDGTLTIDGDIIANGVSLANHNHDSVYYTKTNLQTSSQASVHWDNITNVPNFSVVGHTHTFGDITGTISSSQLILATESNLGAVRLATSGAQYGFNTSAIVPRIDHFHKELKEFFGTGVISENGFTVSASTSPDMNVHIGEGKAILKDGYVFEILTGNSITVPLNGFVSGSASRHVLIYLVGTRQSNSQNQVGALAGPDDGTLNLPALPTDAIPLAFVLIEQNDSDGISNGDITHIREYSPVRLYNGELRGYKDYTYSTDENSIQQRQLAWRLMKDGTIVAFNGISTNGDPGNSVQLSSTEVDNWNDAFDKRHTHVYNEVATKDGSDGTGKTWLLTATPASDSNPNNLAGRRIAVFRNGLLQRPGASYDYTMNNEKIIFTEAPDDTDHILAIYEAIN